MPTISSPRRLLDQRNQTCILSTTCISFSCPPSSRWFRSPTWYAPAAATRLWEHPTTHSGKRSGSWERPRSWERSARAGPWRYPAAGWEPREDPSDGREDIAAELWRRTVWRPKATPAGSGSGSVMGTALSTPLVCIMVNNKPQF